MWGFQPLTPACRQLSIGLTLAWLCQAFLPWSEWLTADPAAILQGQVWRLLSFPLALGSLPLSFLSLLVWLPFARVVEQSLGSVRFRRLFWTSSLLGALVNLASIWSSTPIALSGLTLPLLATLSAFALLYPRRTIYLLAIIPIPSRLLLPLLLLGLALYPSAAWPALLSPLLLAYLMVRKNWLMQASELLRRQQKRKSRLSDTFQGPKVTELRPKFPAAHLSDTELQVEGILDKLRLEGMAGLTQADQELLESQSRRLRHGDERK